MAVQNSNVHDDDDDDDFLRTHVFFPQFSINNMNRISVRTISPYKHNNNNLAYSA